MAVETYPSFLQDATYSAETLRHVFGTMLERGATLGSITGGLVATGDMLVTAGSGMQVLVAVGEAWIPGTSVSTQGGYLGRVTSSTALAISASSESNPRIDTIIAQVQDKAVAGGTDSFSVSVVVGTATSGATLANKLGVGSVPASSLVLAYVLVPAKAVSIVSGDIENVAKLATLGPNVASGAIGTTQLANGAATGPILGSGTVRQETATTQSFLSWGMISEAAAIEASTGDFTITKTGTGEYEVTWTKAKSSADYAVLVVTRLLVGLAEVSGQTTAKFNIKTGQVAEPGQVNLKNLAFSLIVVAAS